jgi:hypothetical protein
VPDDAAVLDRLQPTADRPELLGAVGTPAAELHPRVAQPLGMRVPAAQQQVPLHPLLPVAVGLDPVRSELAVEQERQRQGQHLGLAGAVVAAQQEPAVVEVELLHVVVEEVHESGTQRLPALGGRGRQHHCPLMTGSSSA